MSLDPLVAESPIYWMRKGDAQMPQATTAGSKSCFSVKKLISTSERLAEHPFAGANTQQIKICSYDIKHDLYLFHSRYA